MKRKESVKNQTVVTTRLALPRLHKNTLHRPRLTARLLEVMDHRLAVVQAGAGYGKSTALTALSGEPVRLIWYHVSEDDADPLVFMRHLIHGFGRTLPDMSAAPLAMLEEWERQGRGFPWTRAVDDLMNDLAGSTGSPILLVVDDAHHLNAGIEALRILDWLVGRAPDRLHLILSTRYPIKLPGLVRWRVRGELLEIDQEELAFTLDEVRILFSEEAHQPLTPGQIQLLTSVTEGWAIALQLVRQHLKQPGPTSLAEALESLSGSASDLFTYLAQEVLQQQPDDVRRFMKATAVLGEMEPELCNCLRQQGDSAQLLEYLSEQGLFVVDLGRGHLRYHHLFADLLRQQMSDNELRSRHQTAAECYESKGRLEQAVAHHLAAGNLDAAASNMAEIGADLLRAGRLDTLAGWIGSLSPQTLTDRPLLLIYLGDIARLHSRFDEALGWYQQAEQRARLLGDKRRTGQALRGQARIYLDTVNPTKAERSLQEALRLSDGQDDRRSQARLLTLLAENLLNRGQLEESRRYQAQAQELEEEGPAEAMLSLRVLLRTGRLAQAQQRLEEMVADERRNPIPHARAHRETLLLLSLIYSFQGKEDAARETAIEGTRRGQALNSPFVTAVGQMRQGHAWLLKKDSRGYEEGAVCFKKAIDLSESLAVPRLKVEALWGLTQAHGFGGELDLAERSARKGAELAQMAGDAWIAACVRTSMGGAFVQAGRFGEAAGWLDEAVSAYRECGDTHGEAAGRLWQCIIWHRQGDQARFERDMASLLCLVREHGYEFLFQRRTLFGPPDPRNLVPLLLSARDVPGLSAAAGRILSSLGLAQLTSHPGYQLRMQLTGPFRMWRGRQEVPSGEWRRQTARQLLHLLLTNRQQMLHRDQIADLLWPDKTPADALRDFKIAYNALNRVLEPGRLRNAPSAYVVRDGALYGWRPDADVWLDVEAFVNQVAEGDEAAGDDPNACISQYRAALNTYQGEYLQEYPYDDWCSEERERLLTLYLRTAERLANKLSERGSWQEVIDVCRLILARDNCWEHAYRLTMRAYSEMGNRVQAARTYQRCVENLRSELGVEPAPATEQLFSALV